MKNKLRSLILISCLFPALNQNSYAQSAMAASNADLPASCSSTGITHTNNDYRAWGTSGKMSVIVYDGSTPSLYWDDGAGNTGTIALGLSISTINPIIVQNPDVSLSADASWAVVVYNDNGNNDDVYAELFMWNTGTNSFVDATPYISVPYYKLGTGGIDVKIDCYYDLFNTGEYGVVWRKSDFLALFTCAGDMSGGSAEPVFTNLPGTQLQASGSVIFSAPDVSVLDGDIFYTYAAYDGTNSTLTVETQLFSDVFSASLAPTSYESRYSSSNYIYDLPRISSDAIPNQLIYKDWAVVAQAQNLTTGGSEIHGFVKNKSGVNTSPYVYNDGSLAFTSPNDITSVPNNNPVISYVGDYIFLLWNVDNTSSTISGIDGNEIVAIRMSFDGYTIPANSDFYFIVNKEYKGDQYAPSISGRYTQGSANLNIYLAAFYNSDVGAVSGIDVYYKKNNFFTYPLGNLFRKATANTNLTSGVYPNPFVNSFTVNLPYYPQNENVFKIAVTNLYGDVVYEIDNIKKNQFTYNSTSDITPGIYSVKVTEQNTGKTSSYKLNKL